MRRLAVLLAWVILLLAGHASAYDGLVEKQIFSMPSYTTVEGEVIKDLRIGYETYGTLSASKDNAITQYISFLDSGLAILGGISGLDLSSLLNFAP